MSAPRSSRLSARVDLYLRFRGEPDTVPMLGLCGFTPTRVSWLRNRPAQADTLDVEIPGDVLPFDPRAIADRGARIEAWLFEHQTPSACKRGEPGHFSGVVDDIRKDVFGNTWSFQCRDTTAFAIDHRLTEEQLGVLRVQSFPRVEQLIQAVVSLMPGANWRVQSYASEGLAEAGQARSDGPGFLKPPKMKGGGKRKSASTGAASMVASVSSHRGRLGGSAGQGQVSVWQAVCEACAMAGIVPEVTVNEAGNVEVGLYDASALQTSSVLRPFRRGNRAWRLLVEGRDMTTHEQHLSLTEREGRPAFVRVSSVEPVLGTEITAQWPPDASKNAVGSFQFVDGVSSVATLTRLAKAAWEAFAHNAFDLSITVPQPWSSGGGPDDPDLLGLGYGAAVEIGFSGLDKVGISPARALAARGVHDPEAARRILAATRKIGDLNLLFQCFEVKHEWSGGSSPSYSCNVSLRQFLGSTAMPIVGVDVDVPRSRASEVA